MRLIEIVLFLTPFAAFAVLRVLRPRERVPGWLLVAFGISLAIMLGFLLVLHQFDAADADRAYVPARLENGRVVPGHAAP